MLKLLVIIGIFCVTTSWGQTFDNIRVQKDEDKIIIVYDLVSIDLGSKVNVRIFSSLDDYKLPLDNVSGDIGTIVPGPNKRIHWKVGEAIANSYQGISFKFEGQSVAGWRIISPTTKNVKRGKKITIKWQGEFENDDIIIQLLKSGSEVIEIAKTKNTNSFIWKPSNNLKPGSGYVIRLTSGDNSVEHRFSIKRKIPIGYYCLPVAGLVIFLATISGGSGSDDLPDAPEPN